MKAPWQKWTGKTPVTLLNEWCQKHKHSRPVYAELKCKEPNKFRFRVTFRDQKAKPNEGFVNVVQHTPQGPDQLFARHCAAVIALHHLNSHLQLYRVMAPEFRPIWEACDAEAKELKALEVGSTI